MNLESYWVLFYLMERKHGVVIRAEVPVALDAPEERRLIGFELVDALVEITASISQGLQGKSEGFLELQLKRWQSQASLTVGKVRELPGLDAVTGWLIEHKPASSDLTVVHGDYKLDNVMFVTEAPTSSPFSTGKWRRLGTRSQTSVG